MKHWHMITAVAILLLTGCTNIGPALCGHAALCGGGVNRKRLHP